MMELHAAPRQPLPFRERVLRQFLSSENLEHIAAAFRTACGPGDEARPRLAFLLKTLPDAAYRFARGEGRGGALLDTDPLAERGRVGRGGNFVEEIQHLNRSFFAERMRTAAGRPELNPAVARTLGGPGAPVDNEPLFYQMFVADSLRPPGLEGLNGAGPLWAHHEDRAYASELDGEPSEDPHVPPEDRAWSAGDAYRTPEMALAQYYGEETPLFNTFSEPGAALPLEQSQRGARLPGGRVATVGGVARGRAVEAGRAGSVCGWDGFFARPDAAEVSPLEALYAQAAGGNEGSGGARYQRRNGIPVWQKGGRRSEAVTGRWL